jgi:hypothetical protein
MRNVCLYILSRSYRSQNSELVAILHVNSSCCSLYGVVDALSMLLYW